MSEHTKGDLKADGLYLYCEDFNGRRTFVCKMDNVSAPTEEMLANTQRLVKCWNEYDRLKAKEAGHDDLLVACKNSPASNFFSDFAKFAEECSLKPSMAVYRNHFTGLVSFLRSCVDRAEKVEAAIAKAKE